MVKGGAQRVNGKRMDSCCRGMPEIVVVPLRAYKVDLPLIAALESSVL